MKRLTAVEQAALEDLRETLEKISDDSEYRDDFYSGMKNLVERGFITAGKNNENEFFWKVTEDGQEFMDKYGDMLNGQFN